MVAAVNKQSKQQIKKQKKQVQPKPPTSADKLAAFGVVNICGMIIEGLLFQNIAKLADVPRTTLTSWLETEHSDLYARAREARYHRLAEEVIEIADDSTNDTYQDENGNERTNTEVVARSRLRVDARKWYVAKMLPKQYGDKIAVGGADDLPPIKQDVTVTMTPDEAYRKLLDGGV